MIQKKWIESSTICLISPGRLCVNRNHSTNRDASAHRSKNDAVPGRLRNPCCLACEGVSVWVARPHTSVASLFAARFRVWTEHSHRSAAIARPPRWSSRTFREKRTPSAPDGFRGETSAPQGGSSTRSSLSPVPFQPALANSSRGSELVLRRTHRRSYGLRRREL
jgi:hypothetical protein